MKNLLKMTNFHKLLFLSSFFPFLFFMIYFENLNVFDSAFILYSLSFFFSTAILIFWTYWYIKSTNRSTIFIINGLLIFSMWYRTGFDIYSRAYFIIGDIITYKKIITSDIWAYRIGFQLLILLWLLTWIASRIFRGEEYFRGYHDEKNDHYFDHVDKDFKPAILAVDDEKECLYLLKQQIDTLEGYDFYSSSTLEDGLELFKQRRYYLVILDLRFQNKSIKDVIQFCKQIREIDRFVFLTILTGYFDQAFNHELIGYIDDILSKPYSFVDLKTKLLVWNLRYRRRIYYIKDLNIKIDCVKNTVTKMLGEQGKSTEFFNRKEDSLYG